MARSPSLFVSHGSPMLAICDSPANQFLQDLGKTLPRPKAILMVSAHWETVGEPTISLAAQPETIHDFAGFPAPLYAIQYRAQGAIEMAKRVASLLEQDGIPIKVSNTRGLDHGAWIPLSLMYPEVDIPVAQLSLVRGASTEDYWRIGRAIRSLRDDGVLIIGSGSLTHNLYEFRSHKIDTEVPTWVSRFDEWMKDKLENIDLPALLNYRKEAPFGERNHPSEEHLLPLFVAMGAAGEIKKISRLHGSYEYGVLAMDMYQFD